MIACAFGAAAGYALTSSQPSLVILCGEMLLGAAAGVVLQSGYGRKDGGKPRNFSMQGLQLLLVGLLVMAVGGLSAAVNNAKWYLTPILLFAILLFYGWFRKASLADIEMDLAKLFEASGKRVTRILYGMAQKAIGDTAAVHLFGGWKPAPRLRRKMKDGVEKV